MTESLVTIGKKHNAIKNENTLKLYEMCLASKRHYDLKILEIGVAGGGSLRMLKEYFEKAYIRSMDIEDKVYMEEARIRILRGDQANREELKRCVLNAKFDIIIEDGGHTMEQQQISLGFLFPYLKPGGFYAIEDLQTSLSHDSYKERGAKYGATEEESTLHVVDRLMRFKDLKSEWMTPSEAEYVKDNVDECFLHSFHGNKIITCIIRKRSS
jgi:cephalosporin hydroxylase